MFAYNLFDKCQKVLSCNVMWSEQIKTSLAKKMGLIFVKNVCGEDAFLHEKITLKCEEGISSAAIMGPP